jgi:hypothetical protein
LSIGATPAHTFLVSSAKQFFEMKGTTVWAAVYDVFRAYNITTIFGNPGSTGKSNLTLSRNALN